MHEAPPSDSNLGAYHVSRALCDARLLEVLADSSSERRSAAQSPCSRLGELHLSEDAASKRIQAARVARDFPAIFDALSEGRLHLSAVVLIAPQLKEGTAQEMADELIAAAAHKSKSEIEVLLARRFPQPDVPTRVQAVSPPSTSIPFAVEHAP